MCPFARTMAIVRSSALHSTAFGGIAFFAVDLFLLRGRNMLRWALIFLIVALVAGVFGFGGIAGDAAWIAKILLIVFVILALVSFVMGRRGPGPM